MGLKIMSAGTCAFSKLALKKKRVTLLSVWQKMTVITLLCMDGGALQRTALNRGLAEIESSQVLKTSEKTP